MFSPGHVVRLRSNASTNTGRVRENNEDKVLLWARDHFVLAIVADGMGGAAAGEEASRIAVETIHSQLVELNVHAEDHPKALSADLLSDNLREVVQLANDKIVQHAVQYPELKGMGTTVTLALVKNAYAIIGHVGDSRAYLVDGYDGSISQITSDQSFVEAMVAAGHISRAEAEDHPMRNVLYRALGQSEDVDVDIYHSYLRSGDRLVLCSDGLTLHVKPHEIAKIVLSDKRPDFTTQRLIDLANERGGRDNVSVVVINVEEEEQVTTSLEIDATLNDEDDTMLIHKRRHPTNPLPSETAPISGSASAFSATTHLMPKEGKSASSMPPDLPYTRGFSSVANTPAKTPPNTHHSRRRSLILNDSHRRNFIANIVGQRSSFGRDYDPLDTLGEGRDPAHPDYGGDRGT